MGWGMVGCEWVAGLEPVRRQGWEASQERSLRRCAFAKLYQLRCQLHTP